MTTYTATEYEEMIRTEAAPIPVGYCIRDDGDGMCAVTKAEPGAALEAFHEALYDAAQRMLSHYAESPLGARVYVCGQMPPPDDDGVRGIGAGLLRDYTTGDLQDAVEDALELTDGSDHDHVHDELKRLASDPAHPLHAAIEAYHAAVLSALTEAMKGCWTTTGDEVVMDQETLDLLKAEGVDL